MAGRRLSIEQRQFIVESMITTSSNVKTRRRFFIKFNFRVSDKAVRELHSKWKKDGTARDMHAARSGRPVTARTSANVQKVRGEIESDKNISIFSTSTSAPLLPFQTL